MNVKMESNDLVNKYSDYVVKIAQQIKRNLHPNIETQDLVSYGMTGLIEAANRFNPKLGVNFTTYSYYRIKGAIYDGLRCMGSLSRTEYKRQTHEEKEWLCVHETQKLNTSDDFTKKAQQTASIYLVSLEQQENISIKDENIERADDLMAKLQLYEKMKKAIGYLSKKEQDIIKLYYFEELSLEEVGNKMGLSKSWTSRKHAKALEKLSDRFFNILKEKNKN